MISIRPKALLTLLFALSICRLTTAAEETFFLLSKSWFEARTPHFQTYSCGPTQDVAKLTARLEQFRTAYEALAGTQAVASPPIIVIALPDHEAMRHFVPLYQGQPISLSGFFHRGNDENLIVLSLAEAGSGGLETIFHEYAHLLFRRNQELWPMWLNEGMADIYATFEVTGDHSVRVGKEQPIYLKLLAIQPLVPLSTLFAVTHDSPEYNERERQGIFYAESWLLTHYLMIGSPSHRARLGDLTSLLRRGQTPEQAFTNAFHVPLAVIEKELARYREQNHFESLGLAVRANLLTAQPMITRGISPAEVSFRLGDELLRMGRTEQSETFFAKAASLAPESSFSSEGKALLAVEKHQHREALEALQEAIKRGSRSFLVHYLCAREQLVLSAPSPDLYKTLEGPEAAEIQKELETSLTLMPQYGPAHHLMGFFQLIQGEDLTEAIEHLKKAIDLEPENSTYLLTLAQVQIAAHDRNSARITLEALLQPHIDGKLRAHAQEMLKGLGSLSPK